VTQNANGNYSTEIGYETFDAETDVSPMDGKILAVAKKREFPDVTLTRGGDPVSHQSVWPRTGLSKGV
jgi:hypothetical protein